MKKCAVYIEKVNGDVFIKDKNGNAVYKAFKDSWKACEFARNMGHDIAYDAKSAKEMEEKAEIMSLPFTEETMCIFCGGEYHMKKMTVAEVRKACKISGKHSDMSELRSRGGLCHAHIFDNAPEVEGYVGPMWGGLDTPLRYEASKVFEQMSI